MSIWRKAVTSEQTDEKIRVTGRRTLFALFALFALLVWTYAVRGIHDYCYAMSAWSDGASKRGPDDWTPYIVLWFVPVLVALLIGFSGRASMRKKSDVPKA